jgi:hypothetical protein
MKAAYLVLLLVLFLFPAAGLLTCGHSNQMTYTGPPPRTTPLDTTGAGHRKSSLPPKILTVDFEVPGADSCRVKIEVHNSSKKLIRDIVDSAYAPGKYSINWIAKSNDSVFFDDGVYYYQFDICGRVFTRTLRYRSIWK